MRICHVITALTMGGAQTLLLELAKGLMAAGHEVCVIGLYEGVLRERFEEAGIPVTELSLRGLVDPFTFIKLQRQLAALKPDIVHTHLGKADFYGRLAAYSAGVKSIYSTCHNIEDWKRSWMLRLADEFTLRFVRNIVSVSSSVTDSLTGCTRAKTVTIPNGVNTDDFSPKNIVDKPNLVFAVVGRLEEQKGHSYLFRAIAAVRQAGAIRPGTSFWVIGVGGLDDQLRMQVASLGIEDLVEFKGLRTDVKSLMAQDIDVLLLPSLWEGLPIVLLEGMATGLPSVASGVGGVRELLQHGVNGYVVRPAHVMDLATAISEISRNLSLRQTLGNEARKTIDQRYSIRETVRLYLRLYEQEAACLEFCRKAVYTK